MPRITPSKFVEIAYSIKCIQQLPAVKAMKACNVQRCNRNDLCCRCIRIRRLMCIRYHVYDPVVELLRRLIFEFVFDYITYDQIASDEWLQKGHRDNAHKIKKCNTL